MTVLAAIGENRQSENVISAAYDLALTYDEPLIVLHVVPENEFQSYKKSIKQIPGVNDFSFTQKKEGAAQFARKRCMAVLDDFNDGTVRVKGRVGDPVEEILAEANAIDPQYLVIGGQRRSPAGKAVFGNITQKLLLQAEWPVVTIMLE